MSAHLSNMYRVGDYVYFETSSSSPYQIRRIEELNKTSNGNIEAKVLCFYRRRDLPSSLIQMADKHTLALEEDNEIDTESLSDKQRHLMKHRELFLSRQLESLPATHIRGKCVVNLLNETESIVSYLDKDDTYFYSLVYDPVQKTLLADKGEIRVGSRYQAEVPALLKENESDGRIIEELEALVWSPDQGLTDKQIDQYMIVARSVGTFARALDCSSSVKQPSLHMSAAAASRDITLINAMNILHKKNYELSQAILCLIPHAGPVLCRDQMEEWSASEANLFEEALEKYSKDFNDIRQDFLQWKSLPSIIEYYYMWKTTDRYVQQKRIKAAEAANKLKQVYIPNYNKVNPTLPNSLNNSIDQTGTSAPGNGRACESCFATQAAQWYSWGPPNLQCRLCTNCWMYWKKYGGLKVPTKLEQLEAANASGPFPCTITGCGKEFRTQSHLARHCATAHGLTIRGEASKIYTVRTRQAFHLCATQLTRRSRRICSDILKPRSAARNPFKPINIAAIKHECQGRMPVALKSAGTVKKRHFPKVVDVVKVLEMRAIQRVKNTPADSHKPPGGDVMTPSLSGNVRKRSYESTTSTNNSLYDAPAAKRSLTSPSPLGKMGTECNICGKTLHNQTTLIHHLTTVHSQFMENHMANIPHQLLNCYGSSPLMTINQTSSPIPIASGYVSNSRMSAVNGGPHHSVKPLYAPSTNRHKKKRINWIDAKDDVYFVSTDSTRRVRRMLKISEQKKAARQPCKLITILPRQTPPTTASIIMKPQPTADPIVIDD